MNIFVFSTGETENVDESVQQKENSFVNLSYDLNITQDSNYSDKFNILFEVCKGKKMASECIFKWRKQSKEISVTTWSPDQKTVCSGQHRNLSKSLLMFTIQISQPVVHSLSLLKLSITDTETMFKTLRLTRVNVLREYIYIIISKQQRIYLIKRLLFIPSCFCTYNLACFHL